MVTANGIWKNEKTKAGTDGQQGAGKRRLQTGSHKSKGQQQGACKKKIGLVDADREEHNGIKKYFSNIRKRERM